MAVFPVAPGNPDYGTGSSSQYIPAIYSALLIKKFYPTTVFGEISNTDYTGDIKDSGDTIYIRTRPTIETFAYKKGMVLPVQNPESPYVTMKIDQGEGFSFALDKVDEFQSDIKLMNIWAEDATAQMKQVIDRKLLATIANAGLTAGALAAGAYTTGPTLNFSAALGGLVNGATTATGTTVVLGTGAAAVTANTGDLLLDRILKYGRYLDENNAPDDGRFVILPVWAMQLLKGANSKLAQVYITGDQVSPIRNGKVGRVDRFDIYGSNNLVASTEAVTDVKSVIFGCKYATTFATQIIESRIIDNPFAFGKMMQGLQVYGFNVVKPQLLGVDWIKNA